MNTGTLVHSKYPKITIEVVDFNSFVTTKIVVTDPDGSEFAFEVISQDAPAIQLLPNRGPYK